MYTIGGFGVLMTKEDLESLYSPEGRNYAVYNPNNKPLSDLPVIYGFNNGGYRGWYDAVALAEDGTCLGGHICSLESYMYRDLGIISGSRKDRHEDYYMKHYPDGYRMDFVIFDDVKHHEELKKAIKIYKEKHNND